MTQHTSELDQAIAQQLEPWTARLGADRKAYFHHVLRVLRLADLLFAHSGEPGEPPSAREEFRTAAVFHDLGIWAAGTFDYLEPSCALAGDWLIARRREDLTDVVGAMIRDHHRVRPAGSATDPAELFRRADLIDVTFGARRYGLPFSAYSALTRRYPDSGFHFKLVELTVRRALIHPLSPLPMMRW
ncbi:HD domain-containing protein [Nocardia sp. NPDC058658]|uniref:HD domain-containing protein n=1 Tax=Nocardia sp. NPDC058658 TaxID=3346580 RepID=UPI0036590766